MAERVDLRVILSEAAIAELSELGRWIAERADMATAEAYVSRVETACDRLGVFPNRGTPHFDLGPGVRTVAFERRMVIAYCVEDGTVRVLRLIPAARDLARAFRRPE